MSIESSGGFEVEAYDEFANESYDSMVARRDEFRFRLQMGSYSSEIIRRILVSNVDELDLQIQGHSEHVISEASGE